MADRAAVAIRRRGTPPKQQAASRQRPQQTLRAQPDEGAGWDAIAPIYLGGQRYADAADAYRQAIRLLGPSAKRLVLVFISRLNILKKTFSNGEQ